MIPLEAQRLRLSLNADDRWRGRPLYRVIVETARADQGAGASVFPVDLGYGTHRRIHDLQSEYTSFAAPVVIDLVDAPERIARLLARLGPMALEVLAVVDPVRVVRHAHHGEPAGQGSDGELEQAGGAAIMAIEGEAQRVTVYVGSSDTWQGKNLSLAIIERCRALGLAGATATRGVMGFGEHSVIHRARFLGLSEGVPERIEIVDRADRIARLLPVLASMVAGGLITIENVQVVHRGHELHSSSPPAN